MTFGPVFDDPFARIVGRSAAAEAMRAFGRRAASVDAPVLILGESGTGKGVLARAIHDASLRARRAFVAVNCAAIPESLFESEFFGHVRGAFTGAQFAHKGLFEQADGGTLFLDEIGEMPLTAQAKLLTTIEDLQIRKLGGERMSSVNVRIIAATACDLHEAVAQRRFRNDLFHRLRVLHFHIAPLRQRYGDIEILAHLFLAHYAQRYSRTLQFSEAALGNLESGTWPGNVRELAHAIEAAVLATVGDVVNHIALDAHTSPAPPTTGAPRARYSFTGSAFDERRMIELALHQCGGNRTRAAAELGMSRNTLLNKLRKLGNGLWLILLFNVPTLKCTFTAQFRAAAPMHGCVSCCQFSKSSSDSSWIDA